MAEAKEEGKAAGRGVVVPPRENTVPWQICRATDVIMSHLAAPQATERRELTRLRLPPPPQDCRVVEILRDLGCSPELLSRLQERLDVTPPSAPPLVSSVGFLKYQHDVMEFKLTKARQALSDNSDIVLQL